MLKIITTEKREKMKKKIKSKLENISLNIIKSLSQNFSLPKQKNKLRKIKENRDTKRKNEKRKKRKNIILNGL
jgi:hypothetical protein